MLRSVRKVKALGNYELLLTFDNGEQKIYDVKPLFELPLFEKLKDEKHFNKVYIDKIMDTIAWDEDTDICPDSLYCDGIAV
jgi:hypothetical protein